MIHSTEPLFEQFLASVSFTRNESFVFIQKREKTTNQRESKIIIINSKIQTDFFLTNEFLIYLRSAIQVRNLRTR